MLVSEGADASRYQKKNRPAEEERTLNDHSQQHSLERRRITCWKTVRSALFDTPCHRRARRANNVCAHRASIVSTCCATENLRLIVTPIEPSSNRRARIQKRLAEESRWLACLLVSGTIKTISIDRLGPIQTGILLPRAQSSIWAASAAHEFTLFNTCLFRVETCQVPHGNFVLFSVVYGALSISIERSRPEVTLKLEKFRHDYSK